MNTERASRERVFLHTFFLLLLGAFGFGAEPVAAQTCERLSELKLANTTITAAQAVAAGSFTTATGTAGPFNELPAFCRVPGVIKQARDSGVGCGGWIHASGWNRN